MNKNFVYKTHHLKGPKNVHLNILTGESDPTVSPSGFGNFRNRVSI